MSVLSERKAIVFADFRRTYYTVTEELNAQIKHERFLLNPGNSMTRTFTNNKRKYVPNEAAGIAFVVIAELSGRKKDISVIGHRIRKKIVSVQILVVNKI